MTRTLAAHLGTSASAVVRIWRAHGLKPHRVESFRLSNDPRFIEKLKDIVGLYLDPPEHALVLCCDEKTQIQTLDRMQPGLPLKRGRGKTMTHDYKRNGVTTLFAALNMLTGKVLSMTDQLHRRQEWLRFLKTIDAAQRGHQRVHQRGALVHPAHHGRAINVHAVARIDAAVERRVVASFVVEQARIKRLRFDDDDLMRVAGATLDVLLEPANPAMLNENPGQLPRWPVSFLRNSSDGRASAP